MTPSNHDTWFSTLGNTCTIQYSRLWMEWIVNLFEKKWKTCQPNSNWEFIFNNLWWRPLNTEERAASHAKYRSPSLRLERNHEVKEAHAVTSWNAKNLEWSIQATEAKELCGAKVAKRLTTMISKNPDMYSPRKKDNGQSAQEKTRMDTYFPTILDPS